MSAYPLNNTNYNWERRPKKCKCDGGGGGDSEPFDAGKFGKGVFESLSDIYEMPLPDNFVFPDNFGALTEQEGVLDPITSAEEFTALIYGNKLVALYLNPLEEGMVYAQGIHSFDTFDSEYYADVEYTLNGKTYHAMDGMSW